MLLATVMIYGNIHLYKRRKNINSTGLSSYIGACCAWMLYLFAVTEVLSLFHMVRFLSLFAVWGTLDGVLFIMLVLQWGKYLQEMGSGSETDGGRQKRSHWPGALRRMCGKGRQFFREAPYYGILLAIGAAVVCLAILTTPNNWDSMTYHLPRIVYWAQNRSVEHYATNSIRQISSPVLAEFINLHVYILCRGRDLFFNLLQAASYLTCAVMVGAIAGRLGCDRKFRFLAMLLYMSMPIAYAEALTTQVDNFATVWLLFFVYLLLDLAGQKEKIIFDRVAVCKVCMMGLCVAWGYLAKPSVCFGMVFFALWLLIVCIARKDRLWHLVRLAGCALPCVILPILPELLRNFKTFHAYASAGTGARQLVGTLQPSYLFINFLKNFTFNMPTALLKDSDEFFIRIARKAARILQVELNAKSIAEDGLEYSMHSPSTYGCDTAVNPLVLWLFVFCSVWVVLQIRKTDWKSLQSGYLLTSAISFCVFCTALRWEPFVSRYMVSYLALLCPMIVSQIQIRTETESRRPLRYALIGITGFLGVIGTVSVTHFHYEIWAYHGADNRPYGYFASRRDPASYYAAVTDQIKSRQYQSVGLYLMKGDDYEYPLWMMLDGCRIEHIYVENESAVYADQEFTPDCIVWFGALPKEVTIHGREYKEVTDFGEEYYLLECSGGQ
ncbi:hypothetical protein D7V83_17355 [bacterium 0.1xD8-71]|nr:hypothetical protein D7V83_17355 [bacterium 0.1xD8-71]